MEFHHFSMQSYYLLVFRDDLYNVSYIRFKRKWHEKIQRKFQRIIRFQ